MTKATAVRPPWTLARLVLAIALFTPLPLTLVLFGVDPLAFPPILVLVLVQVATGVLLAWKNHRWAAAVGAVALVLLAVMNAAFLAPNALRPDLGKAFIGAIAFLLLAPLGIVAGVAAFREARAARFEPVRWGSPGAVATLLVAGLALGVAYAGTAGHLMPVASAGAVALTPEETRLASFEKFEFVPGTLTIPVDRIVHITVENKDAEMHTFTVAGLGLDGEVPAGKAVDLWIEASTTGTFQLTCKPHSEKAADGTWEGMVGTLVVQ